MRKYKRKGRRQLITPEYDAPRTPYLLVKVHFEPDEPLFQNIIRIAIVPEGPSSFLFVRVVYKKHPIASMEYLCKDRITERPQDKSY